MTPQDTDWKVTLGSVDGVYIVHDKEDRIGVVPAWNGTRVYQYRSVWGAYLSCEVHGKGQCEHLEAVKRYEEATK